MPGPVWRLDGAEMNHKKYLPAEEELQTLKIKLAEELDRLL